MNLSSETYCDRLNHLTTLFHLEEKENFVLTSRIHPLNGWRNCFIKRDDELGFGISGTKRRKYSVLLSFLRSYQEVAVIGSAFSNHVLSMTQLLIENQISPLVFLKKSKSLQPKGNFLLLQMLLPSSHIFFVEKHEWSFIEKIASQKFSQEGFILKEAATIFPTFLGGLSLPLDILNNEKEKRVTFDHIFMDVGSGYSAAACLLAFSYLKHKAHFHLILVAERVEDFSQHLKALHTEFQLWLKKSFSFPTNWNAYQNKLAPSFGSTNAKLFSFITQFAREQGIFLDPIYSGKLFHEAQDIIKSQNLSGNILIIHSGGALTLMGFQDQLKSYIH